MSQRQHTRSCSLRASLRCTVEEVHTLSALILAAWSSGARSRLEPEGEIWHHRGMLRWHALVDPPLVPMQGAEVQRTGSALCVTRGTFVRGSSLWGLRAPVGGDLGVGTAGPRARGSLASNQPRPKAPARCPASAPKARRWRRAWGALAWLAAPWPRAQGGMGCRERWAWGPRGLVGARHGMGGRAEGRQRAGEVVAAERGQAVEKAVVE
jgi:hypothetical protein